MAMAARIVTAGSRPSREWIVVARWGPAGEYLSLGRTSQAIVRAASAPIHLRPRETALAELLPRPDGAGPRTFLLSRDKPEAISVIGQFLPTDGCVRLLGSGTRLRLKAEGRCLTGPSGAAWRLDAVRVAWIGEFVEEDSSGADDR